MGAHLVTHWSRTQTCIALSSGEAELNAMLKAACEGLQIKHVMSDLGEEMGLHLKGDSSASHGTLSRMGTGRVKHLQTRQLWLQERVKDGDVELQKIPREKNWADLLTHSWSGSNENLFASMGITSISASNTTPPTPLQSCANIISQEQVRRIDLMHWVNHWSSFYSGGAVVW